MSAVRPETPEAPSMAKKTCSFRDSPMVQVVLVPVRGRPWAPRLHSVSPPRPPEAEASLPVSLETDPWRATGLRGIPRAQTASRGQGPLPGSHTCRGCHGHQRALWEGMGGAAGASSGDMASAGSK